MCAQQSTPYSTSFVSRQSFLQERVERVLSSSSGQSVAMEKPYPISESAAPSKPSFVRRDSSTKLEYATFEGNKWINSEEVQAVKYDPKEPALAIFSRWRGTVLPLVANSQMFQLLMLIHFFFLFINFFVVPLQPMDSEVIVGLPASMLIFLVVFYNGNCYTR